MDRAWMTICDVGWGQRLGAFLAESDGSGDRETANSVLKFIQTNRGPMSVAFGGMLLLVLLLYGLRLWFRASRKRSGAKLVDGLASNIESLREKFREGIEEIGKSGKVTDPITAPWYIMVGEPGAGKTEAIRHANINLLPGMNNLEAGTGGTLNVDWWIAERAILLDTAGRLMFEKRPDGKPNEWLEVLRLLKGARPRCPINGMILAIPCNKLLEDNQEEIQAKAAKIAHEFDRIQKELGVRFPVYVILTKADLLPGFRQYFSYISNPDEQNQMLGWSNPDPLDNIFRPELVEDHLSTVTDRIRRRRQTLLLDPRIVDGAKKRFDAVDAMYAFPSSLEKMGARLRIYLETIFTINNYASKPLFLRGIYFASSMQDGAELDSDLAARLGLSVKKLPDIRAFRQNRVFFLKDVFLEKAFAEKGLVTAGNSVTGGQRLKMAIMLTAATVGVAGVVAWTGFGLSQLQQSVGNQSDFWAATGAVSSKAKTKMGPEWYSVVGPDGSYRGTENLSVSWPGPRLRQQTLEGVHHQNLQLLATDLTVPPIFKVWTQSLDPSLTLKNREMHRRMFENGALYPLIDKTLKKVARSVNSPDEMKNEDFRKKTAAVLNDLVALKYEVASGEPRKQDKFTLQPLVAMLSGNDDATLLDECRETLYNGKPGLPSAINLSENPTLLARINGDTKKCELDQSIRSMVQYYVTSIKGRLDRLDELLDATRAYSQAEEALLSHYVDFQAQKVQFAETETGFQQVQDDWNDRFDKVKRAAEDLRKKIESDLSADSSRGTLVDLVVTCKKLNEEANATFDALAVEVHDNSSAMDGINEVNQFIKIAKKDIEARFALHNRNDAKDSELPDYDKKILGLLPGSRRPFEARVKLYDLCDTDLRSRPSIVEAGGPIADIRKKIETASNLPRLSLGEFSATDNGVDLRALKTCELVGEFSLRKKKSLVYKSSLEQFAKPDPDFWTAQVKTLATSDQSTSPASLPLHPATSTARLDDTFSPVAADKVYRDWVVCVQVMKLDSPPLSSEAWDKLRERSASSQKQYADAYTAYWKQQFDDLPKVVEPSSWTDYRARAFTSVDASADGINSELKRVGETILAALAPTHDFITADLAREREDLKNGLGYLASTNHFAPQSSKKLSAWKELSQKSTADARADIAGRTPRDVVETYVSEKAASNEGNFVSRYWYGLTTYGLKDLAIDSSKLYDDESAYLVNLDATKFPVNLNAKNSELSPTDYATFVEKISKLHPRESTESQASDISEINQLREKIIFGNEGRTPAELDSRTQIQTWAQTIAWLESPCTLELLGQHDPINVTIRASTDNNKSNSSVVFSCRYVVASQGDKPLTDLQKVWDPATTNKFIAPLDFKNFHGLPIKFECWNTQADHSAQPHSPIWKYPTDSKKTKEWAGHRLMGVWQRVDNDSNTALITLTATGSAQYGILGVKRDLYGKLHFGAPIPVTMKSSDAN